MKKIIVNSTKTGDYSLINDSEREFILKNIKNNQKLENFLFQQYSRYQVKDLFDYLNHAFLLLLNFKDKEVLNIGCGEGTESIFFARLGAKQVYSFDLNPNRLKMLKANAKRNNVAKKIQTIQGDFVQSKLLKESFDIITMIGVLEWMSRKNPYQEHIQYLKKVRHGLKTGGKFLLAIENRTSPLYFVGITHHNDIPFSPLMPRFLADLISRIWRNKPYTTYTYTRKQYIKLFKKAGFKKINIYPVLFGYQEPKFVFNSPDIFRILLKKYGTNPMINLCTKVLSMFPNFLLKQLAPAYIVIGEK